MPTPRKSQRWSEADFDKIGQAKSSPNKSVAIKKYVKPTLSEHEVQKGFLDTLRFLRIKHNGLPLTQYIYAVPNGGYRLKRTAKTLKNEGVMQGVPDLHCFIAIAPYHSLYIEMKREDGDLSESQKHLIPILRAEGHKVVVCRSSQQAVDELLKYLDGNKK